MPDFSQIGFLPTESEKELTGWTHSLPQTLLAVPLTCSHVFTHAQSSTSLSWRETQNMRRQQQTLRTKLLKNGKNCVVSASSMHALFPRPHTEPSRSSIQIGRRWWQGTSTSTQVCVQCTESRTMHATKQGSGMCYSRALKN